MTLILTLAALTGWGYDGFALDPSRPRPAQDAVAPHLSARKQSPPPVLPATARPKPEAPAPLATAPLATAPTVWRLADARGQVWEHTDLNWLRQWVRQRNSAPVVPTAPPTYPVAAPQPWNWNVAPSYNSSCPSGRCPRR